MKILLFGHRGQVGCALRQFAPASHDLIIPDIDITQEEMVRQHISATRPDVIINAAAYTNVDGAEDHIDIAFQTNAIAPQIIAAAAKDHHSLLIHYSTDYVFDGRKDTPWNETDRPNPLNQYGQSKYQGEQAILKSGCRHLIFRTSWIYSPQGNNFIQKIIRLSQQTNQIHVVTDQIGAPTSARFIARATYHALGNPKANGLYHLCCAGETSWYDLARLIRDTHAPQSCFDIQPILSKDYAQKARRPLNSRLDCKKFQKDFFLTPPQWKTEYLENFATSAEDLS